MLTDKERQFCDKCDCSKCGRGCLTCFTCVLKNENIFKCEKRQVNVKKR